VRFNCQFRRDASDTLLGRVPGNVLNPGSWLTPPPPTSSSSSPPSPRSRMEERDIFSSRVPGNVLNPGTLTPAHSPSHIRERTREGESERAREGRGG
jgi:hypothetical protein